MKIERARFERYVVDLHAYELAGLIAATRWAIETGAAELPAEAVEELQRVVASYDSELSRPGPLIGITQATDDGPLSAHHVRKPER